MGKKLDQLIAFLEAEGVDVVSDKVSDFGDSEEPRLIFSEITPDRYCSYDAETIDETDAYISILQAHVHATLGEWEAREISVSGSKNNDVQIEFECVQKRVKWKFEQPGFDYVSDAFYRKLNNWVSRNLGGKFITLPTYGQDMAFVYLPKNAAKKVEAFCNKTVTANRFVDYFRQDADVPGSVLDLGYDYKFDKDCLDDNGETAVTAAIKAMKPDKALIALDEPLEVSAWRKNREGRSPLQLARQSGYEELVSYLEGKLTRKADPWPVTQKLLGTERLNLFAPMIDLVSIIIERKDNDDWHQCMVWIPDIIFARTQVFEIGHETLHVGPYFIVGSDTRYDTYQVQYYSESGTGDYEESDIQLDRALELIEGFYA